MGIIILLELTDKSAQFIVGQTDLRALVFGRRALFYKKGELVKRRNGGSWLKVLRNSLVFE